MKRSLWVSAMIAVVLASGCTYTSRQEPSSGVAVQDDGAGSTRGTQGQSAGGSSTVPAQTGAAEPQAKEAQPEPADAEVMRMEQWTRLELSLEQNQLSAFVSGVGRTTFSVAGELLGYDVHVRLTDQGQTQELSGVLACCELRSTDPQVPFLWAVWARARLDNFHVVSSPGPVSYAAWSDLSVLCFEEIRTSRDAETALAQFTSQNAVRTFTGSSGWRSARRPGAYLPAPGATAPVCLFISDRMRRRAFLNNRGRMDVSVQSIERDAAGQWTVKVTGPKSRKVYTFVSPDGETWERK